MKNLIIISIILGGFLQMTWSQETGSIEGIVFDSTRNEAVKFVNIRMLRSGLGTSSDENGYFKFDEVSTGAETLQYTLLGYGRPRIFNLSIIGDSTLQIKLSLERCEYDILGGGTCPVCRKADEVVPIFYGDPDRKTLKKIRKGEVYYGSTQILYCQPHWFCKRDKIKF